MFIVTSSMSAGAVRRDGTQLALNHEISFRPAEPRRRLMLDQCYKHATPTGVKIDSRLPNDRVSKKTRQVT